MYAKSNRMSGSLSQKNGSPPYFYFRFGGYSPRHGPFWPMWPTCTSLGVQVNDPFTLRSCGHWRQPRRGCRGHIPQYFGWGRASTGISPNIITYFRTFGYSRPILVALRSLSLKPISFGYKAPPIRFSQAGGQAADATAVHGECNKAGLLALTVRQCLACHPSRLTS